MATLSKIDYFVAALAGFLAALFAAPVLLNLGVEKISVFITLPWLAAGAFAAGLWLSGRAGKLFSFLPQFGKFAAVGFLNTAIDFGILNLLSLATGTVSGFVIGGVNVPGFVLASLNSYLWNKFWVFKRAAAEPERVLYKDGENAFGDFPKFLTVTALGIFLNGGIVVLLTTYLTPLFGLSPQLWLNFSKFAATTLTLIWNFLGYKFFVFRAN